MPVQKRLKRVERQVRSQRPEMKVYHVTSTTAVSTGAVGLVQLSDITQGDGVGQRVGNRIKIWRVEIRGEIDAGASVLLLQCHTGATVSYGELDLSRGAGVSPQFLNSKYTEWAFTNVTPHQTTYNPIRIIRKFRGMEVTYPDSTTTALRNRLTLVIQNVTGSSINKSLSARVWFTDA